MAFRDVPFDDGWTLFNHRRSLMRADGSFGYFTLRYAVPHETIPLELVTFGGPVPAGQFRKGSVLGAPGGTLPTPGYTASGIEGYDWVFDDAEWRLPKAGEIADPFSGWVPSEPSLIAIDDRGRVVKRTSLDFGPRTFTKQLVPTGRGLRAIVRVTDRGLDVYRSSGKHVAHLSQFQEFRAVLGRKDGSLLFGGWPDPEAGLPFAQRMRLADGLMRLDTRGKVRQVRDAKGKLVTGDPIAQTRLGVVLSAVDSYVRPTVRVLSDRGRITERKLTRLRLPWSQECLSRREGVRLDWATAGSAGDPIIGVTCFRGGDRTEEEFGSFTVGLDSRLRARWAVEGSAFRGSPFPLVGTDGRLYATWFRSEANQRSNYDLLGWREPGAGQPRRGRVLSVRADKDGAVVVIACRATEGTVCSGTVALRRSGGGTTTLPYALRGRPGQDAAVIRRHFDDVPRGIGRLRATLTR